MFFGQVVERNVILHLTAKGNLGKSKTDGVTELVEVLVLPLCLSISDLVMDILSVHDKIVLDVEDEVPGISEGFGQVAKLVKISADSSLALLELVGDVADNVTQILNSVKDRVELSVLELVNNTSKALPDVLSVTETLNTVGDLSLNGTGKQAFEDLSHAEESEVDVGGFHCLEVVHLLVLLVVDLVEKLLPVIVEIVEELFVVNHLGLTVENHCGGLSEVLAGIKPLAHAVVMETLAGILKNVHTIDDKRFGGLEEDLLGVEEGLGHSLDLLVVMMIDFTTVVKHITNVGDSETDLVNGLGGLLVGSVPEAAHGVFDVLLNGVGSRDAVADVGHTAEVKGSNEESFNEAGDLGVVMRGVSLSGSSNKCSSESSFEHYDVSKRV